MIDDQPTFSIIIPTRGRPKELAKCISSFIDLAADPWHVEYIARWDEDDPTIKDRYYWRQHVKDLVGPRYGGYAENHRLIENAAKHATGKYLMQCVDTAEMLTPEWDRIYEETIQENDICVVASRVIDGAESPLFPWSFPIITRKLYDLAGEFCLGQNPSVDRCWEAFAEEMDCGILAPVRIRHIEKRNTQYEDKTAAETQPFYDDLQNNWKARSAEHKEIGKRYAELVRAKLEN